jgi:hypothetical protein
MGNLLIFYILPFDPNLVIDSKENLPVDFNDFARTLQQKWPEAQIAVNQQGEEKTISLYINTAKEGLWNVAGYSENPTQLYVTAWPKRTAKELILWYRNYIPSEYSLFLLIPEDGYVVELKPQLSLEDIETMYPFPVADE